MKYVIFDLDGCVSDDRHRHSYWKAKEYHNYHSICDRDEPFPASKSLVVHHANDPTIGLVFLTARPYDYISQTLQWIRDELGLLQTEYRLVMRQAGDNRSSPDLKVGALRCLRIQPEQIAAVYDDREDVLQAYRDYGIQWVYRLDENGRELYPNRAARDAADCLQDGIALFRERNGVYKDNHKRFGEVMAALYPDGLTLKGAGAFTQLGLFVQIISKATRYAASENGHLDSVRDSKVYAAMLEAYMEELGHEVPDI